MHNLFRNAAFVVMLVVVSVYAAGVLAVVAALFGTAIVLDALLAGWTRSRAQRANRIDLLDAPDFAGR